MLTPEKANNLHSGGKQASGPRLPVLSTNASSLRRAHTLTLFAGVLVMRSSHISPDSSSRSSPPYTPYFTYRAQLDTASIHSPHTPYPLPVLWLPVTWSLSTMGLWAWVALPQLRVQLPASILCVHCSFNCCLSWSLSESLFFSACSL